MYSFKFDTKDNSNFFTLIHGYKKYATGEECQVEDMRGLITIPLVRRQFKKIKTNIRTQTGG